MSRHCPIGMNEVTAPIELLTCGAVLVHTHTPDVDRATDGRLKGKEHLSKFVHGLLKVAQRDFAQPISITSCIERNARFAFAVTSACSIFSICSSSVRCSKGFSTWVGSTPPVGCRYALSRITCPARSTPSGSPVG